MELGEHALDHLAGSPSLRAWWESYGRLVVPSLSDGVHTLSSIWEMPCEVARLEAGEATVMLRRGPRPYPSRHVRRERLETTGLITVVIRGGDLVTLWAGGRSPVEPTDPSWQRLPWRDKLDSWRYWRRHAFIILSD